MIGRIIKFFIRMSFYVILFFGAVWLFLGMPPQETYARAYDNINKMLGRATNLSQSTKTTVSQMREEYGIQYQHASDRFHGKDPYERLAGQLDKTINTGGSDVNLRGN